MIPLELEAERRSRQPLKPPSLPHHWRASVLPSPFGDGKPPMRNHSQLCVADISYREFDRGGKLSIFRFLTSSCQNSPHAVNRSLR
jgi:hypothetical protein